LRQLFSVDSPLIIHPAPKYITIHILLLYLDTLTGSKAASTVAYMIKEFLQGSWLKHPLHPALVHIPMALWPAALVFDVLAYTGVGGNVMVRTAFYAVGLGLLVTLLAVPAGVADWWDIRRERQAYTLGLYHMGLNVVGTAVWVASFIWRVGLLDAGAVPLELLLLSIGGVLILFMAAYLGGRMTFAYGISVARHTKESWREIAEEGKARLPVRAGGSEDSGDNNSE
jgi:uncharacterized membrane protein